MIAIIDYGMGNLRSVQKAIERVGGETCLTSDKTILEQSTKIVLPGVGAIGPAMNKLNELDLIETIKAQIVCGKPFLGICLGLQLLFNTSDEGGQVECLGILEGEVKRFTSLKVPHMGWNQLKISEGQNLLFTGVKEASDVYFCHSYYVIPSDKDIIASQTDYGISFTSSVAKDNIWAVQFHPEKSQRVGLKILENFIKL